MSIMKTEQALKHFGSNTALTSILGLSSGAISQWGEYPPSFRQLQLEKLSDGTLKAEPNLIPYQTKNKSEGAKRNTPIRTTPTDRLSIVLKNTAQKSENPGLR